MSQNPLRIASLNLNKGGHTADRLDRLADWLAAWAPSFLFLQEPWSHDRSDPARIPHFHFLGGNSNVACYATETEGRHRSVEGVDLFDDRALELLLDDTRLSNVYLPATTSSERRRFLLRLLDLLRPRSAADRAILGDFNLAPRPEDGRYGEAESGWTSAAERKALESLLSEFDLVDLLPQKGAEESPFTFERKNKGKLTRFRCDLALTSRRLAERAETLLQFDHRSRVGSSRFTDHSALILDLPIVLRTRASMIYTHNTAINRGNGSRPLRMLHEAGLLAAGASVLDFGCGRGGDVRWLLEHGFAAEGYDPYPKFGHTDLPSGQYDSVLLLFVVNILPTLEERKAAVARAWQFVKPGGFLYVAARSKREIVSQARDKAWPEHGDGYLTSQSKRTFQKGHDGEDICNLMVDLEDADLEVPSFANKESFTCLLCRKRLFAQPSQAVWSGYLPERVMNVTALNDLFKNTTNTYKYYWFLAILELIHERYEDVIDGKIQSPFRLSVREVVLRMLAISWYPVTEFEINFGSQDQLARSIKRQAERFKNVPNTADRNRLEALISLRLKDEEEGEREIAQLARFVTSRFLSPWFPNELRGVKDCKKEGMIAELSRERFEDPLLSAPYVAPLKLHADAELVFHPGWFHYFKKHQQVLKGYCFWNLLQHLKKKNPGMANLSLKLEAPAHRNLARARKLWKRYLLENPGFVCIYTDNTLSLNDLSIDHYLPWKVVAHDHLWNLIPTSRSVNSSKSASIPNERTLDRFVDVQCAFYNFLCTTSVSPRDYHDLLSVETSIDQEELRRNKGEFCRRMREQMLVQLRRVRSQCGGATF